ncbi:hypothetical protein P167DRAFT_548950 [Morchella conica CCBAS932]|uniref:Uncharacterized protein n=1 Tax=Morchella conica CCBAS932 TaxID=1392247 RepID=A0A3N4KJG6_9PEZI|nr:hypothetical protein P167DRAFT_548950 [Morchella conica CCBAS932]
MHEGKLLTCRFQIAQASKTELIDEDIWLPPFVSDGAPSRRGQGCRWSYGMPRSEKFTAKEREERNPTPSTPPKYGGLVCLSIAEIPPEYISTICTRPIFCSVFVCVWLGFFIFIHLILMYLDVRVVNPNPPPPPSFSSPPLHSSCSDRPAPSQLSYLAIAAL